MIFFYKKQAGDQDGPDHRSVEKNKKGT